MLAAGKSKSQKPDDSRPEFDEFVNADLIGPTVALPSGRLDGKEETKKP